MISIECITTSHLLARELLGKPDSFITAMIGEEEYVIQYLKRAKTHANFDDTTTHLTLVLRDGGQGNIKRWTNCIKAILYIGQG